ncbi:hypothetical protein, partial [Mesorhizobium sp.]
KPMIVEAVGVEGSDVGTAGRDESESGLEDQVASPWQSRQFFADGAWRDAGIFRREDLKPGHKVAGPALV